MNARSLALALVVASQMVFGAGCAAVSDSDVDQEDEDIAALEDELAVHEVVGAGVELRVTASALNLRGGPSTNHKILDVLDQGQRVVTVTKSGEDGWVNVKTKSGTKGWVFNKYVVRVNDGGGDTNAGTCAPSRAAGVVSSAQKALHDSIAWAEGTRNVKKDGYNVLFSYQYISSCAKHPNKAISAGGYTSTAAGRYQFLTSTWKGAAAARNLTSFEPENQERGGAYLISSVRKVSVPQSRAMTASEFANAMSKLSYEWASLPPGRYGQPVKSHSSMRQFYCSQIQVLSTGRQRLAAVGVAAVVALGGALGLAAPRAGAEPRARRRRGDGNADARVAGEHEHERGSPRARPRDPRRVGSASRAEVRDERGAADELATDRSVETLLERLDSDDPFVVLDAADGLRARRATHAIPKLAAIDVVAKPDSARTVIDALGHLAGAADGAEKDVAVERLIALLAQEKARRTPDAPGNVLQIYEALGETADRRAAAALERELADPDVALAPLTVVVASLEKIGLESSVAPLRAAAARVRLLEFEDEFLVEVQKELLTAIDGALATLAR